MAAARHLVVVAGADPPTTDALAETLRDGFAVRTAYRQPDLVASLDCEVDVVLVDTDLPNFDAETLRDRLQGDHCQVGILTDGSAAERRSDSPAAARSLADARVDPAADGDHDDPALREAVERLAARAHYRKRLEEYYEVADEYARLAAGGADANDPERERLADHLDRLRADLAEAYDALESGAAFDAALGSRPSQEYPNDSPDSAHSE